MTYRWPDAARSGDIESATLAAAFGMWSADSEPPEKRIECEDARLPGI